MLRQLVERGIKSTRVLAAMDRVPRERFVPAEVRHLAYADRALPIGSSQTISQPYIVALMTEALELSGGERVLEIGTGSGYQTAILAELAAEVVSVERHAELSRERERDLGRLRVHERHAGRRRRHAGLARAGAVRSHPRGGRGQPHSAGARRAIGRRRASW